MLLKVRPFIHVCTWGCGEHTLEIVLFLNLLGTILGQGKHAAEDLLLNMFAPGVAESTQLKIMYFLNLFGTGLRKAFC
jgi:hypothetical protein